MVVFSIPKLFTVIMLIIHPFSCYRQKFVLCKLLFYFYTLIFVSRNNRKGQSEIRLRERGKQIRPDRSVKWRTLLAITLKACATWGNSLQTLFANSCVRAFSVQKTDKLR
ncbi:hypothetical protein RvY_17257 [Ramazzottius varieornatus]|uniref:Uncharacterized protein n=1 Tax=Ramazzottius varieornatus TaxID=947166 RepID=A0A1D1W1G9_RAMVA|nr:hypothetical protein RvY_17257 [Ramazzottius varieornatus]